MFPNHPSSSAADGTDASSQLFAAVIQVTDLKLGTENLKKIAEIMGDGEPLPLRSVNLVVRVADECDIDCTPKALTHRISKFKALAKGGSGEDKGAEKKAAAPKGKGANKAKKADTPVEGEDDEEALGKEAKGKKGGAKRKKKEESGEDDDVKVKKVKAEAEDEEEF